MLDGTEQRVYIIFTRTEKYKVQSSPYSYTKLICHLHVLYQQKNKSPLFLLLAYSVTLIFTRVSERNVAPFFFPLRSSWCHTVRVRSANAVVWRFVTRARFGCCRRVNELGRELWRRTTREWMHTLCACDREGEIGRRHGVCEKERVGAYMGRGTLTVF